MKNISRLLTALATGGLVAFALVPPVLGFYWGWNTPVGGPGGTWNPWVVAFGQMFMSWVIYPLDLADGDLLSTAEGRSVAVAFLATTLVAGAAAYLRRGGRDG